MHHHLKSIITISILLAIGAALGWYWSQPKPVLVKVQAVERGSVQSTASNTRAGTVKACRRAHLAPAIGGLIAKLPVSQSDHVKSGQLLLELWNHDIVAEIKFAKEERRGNKGVRVELFLKNSKIQPYLEELIEVYMQDWLNGAWPDASHEEL